MEPAPCHAPHFRLHLFCLLAVTGGHASAAHNAIGSVHSVLANRLSVHASQRPGAPSHSDYQMTLDTPASNMR